jgi:hypothetical protein
MPPTPALRASTTKRARPQEVFDKQTTVRGVTSNAPQQLMNAIAATMGAVRPGVDRMSNLRADLVAQEKAQRPKRK